MFGIPRILLVDDHPIFRSGMRTLIERDGATVVEEAATTSDAIKIAERVQLGAATVDVLLPDAGGPALVRRLRAIQPECSILGLSVLEDPLRAAEMLRAGAQGYALKTQPPAEIVGALHTILGGVRYLAPQLSEARVHHLVTAVTDLLQRLTIRERRVFDLLVRGNSNKAIAAKLDIGVSTVETHRRQIMHKLEAVSIVDLVHIALRYGELDLA